MTSQRGSYINVSVITMAWVLSFYEFSIKEYSWELFLTVNPSRSPGSHDMGPWHQDRVMATSHETQHRVDITTLIIIIPLAMYHNFPSIAHHNNIISYILLHSINPVSSDIALIITRTDVRMSHYYLLFILGCSITSRLGGYIMFNQSMKLKHWHPNESKYLAVRAYQDAVMQC